MPVLLSPLSSSAIEFKVNVADTSQNTKPGDRLYFDADFKYPENRQRQDLRVKYEILQDGVAVAESDTLKAVETQIQFYDYIFVPASIKSGSAELRVTLATYEGVSAQASTSFNVTKGEDQMRLYALIVVGAMIFIGLITSLQIYTMHVRTRAIISVAMREKKMGFAVVVLVVLLSVLFLLNAAGVSR